MLYREVIAVCSEIHTKHINILCGQNVELYIKIESVPRSKHTPSQLYNPVNVKPGGTYSNHWAFNGTFRN